MKPADYEKQIIEILEARAEGRTMCPSEVLASDDKKDVELMKCVREAAKRLVKAGRIDIVQRGKVVDPLAFRGPIRLRLRTNRTPK